MEDQVEYLKRAMECLEMAERAKTEAQRQKLVAIARAWQELAESAFTEKPPR